MSSKYSGKPTSKLSPGLKLVLAAEAAYEAVTEGRQHDELIAYPDAYALGAAKRGGLGHCHHFNCGIWLRYLMAKGGIRVWHLMVNGALYLTYLGIVLS